jgi:hypothetical protein
MRDGAAEAVAEPTAFLGQIMHSAIHPKVTAPDLLPCAGAPFNLLVVPLSSASEPPMLIGCARAGRAA